MSKNVPHSPYARKDTFWNKVRVEKNLTTKEIGEIIGQNDKTVSAYFTGLLMPKDYTVKALCDLFDVDYTTGHLEFQHAHQKYRAEHNPKLKYSSRDKKNTPKPKIINSAEDVLESVYGVLTCKEFLDIYSVIIGNGGDIDAMRILYRKVDYDVYNKINKIIGGTK